MLSLSERPSPGCRTVLAAYCLGCYLMLPLYWLSGGYLQVSNLLAPLLVPCYLVFAVLLLAAYDALLTDGWVLLLYIGVLSLAFLASLEFLRSLFDGMWQPLRLGLFAGVYLFLLTLALLQ